MKLLKYIITFSVIFISIHTAVPVTEQPRQNVILICPNGGEILAWDSLYIIRWHDDLGGPYIYDYFFFLSIDGGQSYPFPITGTIIPDSNMLEWIVPHMSSTTCRVLIEVDSGGTNIGSDESDSNFTISETGIEEEESYCLRDEHFITTVHGNSFSRFISATHKIYNITGRQIHTLDPAPGIYFIEVDGEIRQKIIKIR